MSRIRDAFEVEFSLRTLFENPTVAGLAAQIAQSQARAGISKDMTRMLANLESLSNDDAQGLMDPAGLTEEKI